MKSGGWDQKDKSYRDLIKDKDQAVSLEQKGRIVKALMGVDLDIMPGEFVTIQGPTGGGKSTLLHCLAGLDEPTSGRVRIAGVDVTDLGDDVTERRGGLTAAPIRLAVLTAAASTPCRPQLWPTLDP